MKIKDLDLERYVIVYDIGKSECSDGMTIVGKVIELEFDDYDKNKAVIESMQNEYEITDDNEFELWTKSIEDKTEHISDNSNKSVRWIDDNTLLTNLGHKINIPEDMLKDTEFDLDGYVRKNINELNRSNDVQQRKHRVVEERDHRTPGFNPINWLKLESRNDTVNHPSHYNYGDIEIIDFIEQVTQHYNANVAYHIGNAIKYLARSPHKNGKEDVAKAKWYIERAFENWDK